MSHDVVKRIDPQGTPWETFDPFLFCMHHLDAYPAGNASLGPAASLAGRNLGMDFEGRDGWRMYHGETIPGFPAHPHRGFETVTFIRRGFIDHSDSLGATARFGAGDVQWVTAGAGIVHSEMFPLLDDAGSNPLELFQIWLNLPRDAKMVEPHFSMLWREQLPRLEAAGAVVDVVAGAFGDLVPLPPPPESWAARDDAGVAIWHVHLDPGARFVLPPASDAVRRALYLYRGAGLSVDGQPVPEGARVEVVPTAEVPLVAGDADADLLVLQGRPIREPVVQYGPFVLATEGDLKQAFIDYQATGFGGWPWKGPGPVHPRDAGRFARHPGGRVDTP